MYLSRVQVDPVHRGAQRLLGSAQAMHAAVLGAFDTVEMDQSRVLWRVDTDARGVFLYTVSQAEPNFADFLAQIGSSGSSQGWSCRDYDPLLQRLKDGQQWAFRLTANPSFADPAHGGKRFGNVTVAQQEQWLLRRSERCGFEVCQHDDSIDLVVKDRRLDKFNRGGRIVTISKATYDGLLRVVNVERLREAMVTGIGHAKAYGCGLLTLAPVMQ